MRSSFWRRSVGRHVWGAGIVVAAWILGTPPALAQGGRVELNGVVVDQNKGVLPGATVTVINEATGAERTATTGVDGRFVVPTLVPGTYTVRVELAGFQVQTRTGLVLNVGQEVSVEFTLGLAGLSEELTVSGETPVVEVTTSKVGANITNREIDDLPSQGRSQLSLMQLIPGLTPSLTSGTFEGGQYNANGRDTGSNLFLIDGVYNNDDRLGGSQGTQARITLDSMAEYQVLTHQYTAEFGGASGVVVNAVTKSGTNRVAGRTFFYFQDDKLDATDYFLKQRGEDNGDYGSKVFGGNLGGPIVRNKAFWFFNVERTLQNEAQNLNFPAAAAPVAVSYSDTTDIRAINTFLRLDYQMSRNQALSFRWVREAALTVGENLESNLSTPDNVFIENDSGDQIFNASWTTIIGSHATNEFKVAHVRENLLQGSRAYFDDDYNFIELNGRDQFDIGSQNAHPDWVAGPRASHGSARIRTYAVDNAFTYIRSGWAGDHTFKAGWGYSRNLARPQIVGANDNGTFSFQASNRPFDPADPFTYPTRFQIRLGEIYYDLTDWRTNAYVQDKWQLNRRLTLNLGVRYDYQHITPRTKNALAPRFGVAYDLTGDGRTLLRGGVGKFYEYQLLTVQGTLLQQAVVTPSFLYDTGQDLSANRGVIPANVCLQPAGSAGLAVIGPACRAFLDNMRRQVNAGSFVNTEPTLDGNRKLGYLWSFSVGVKRELRPGLAVSADYIGNRGRDQTGLIDINEPVNRVRPGVNVFDPDGTLIPPGARGASFLRVLQFQTRDDLNTDYNALELSVEKRMSSRWSGRFSYTLARARDVGSTGGGTSTSSKRYSDDYNPRSDYGRANFDNRHAVAAAGNVQIWKGLSGGAVFRYYSGYPVNEIVGSDTNGDRDTFDRPVAGVDDATRPIQSPLDRSGRAIRNGIDGKDKLILDGRLQYLWRVQRSELGLFLEVYNLTNRVNFDNPTGNRASANFMRPITADNPRTMQLGIRYTF
jgi:outer membrane receptor protein involved in Fe transport